MKFRYTLLNLFLSLLLIESTFGQRPRPLFATNSQVADSSGSTKQKERRKTKVDVKYNKQKDLSVVVLEQLKLWDTPGTLGEVTMNVSFVFPTHRIVTPKTVSMVFTAYTKETIEFKYDGFEAIIDGQKVDLGHLERPHTFYRSVKPGGPFFDVLEKAVPYEDFARIASGKQVRLIVGGSPYDLSADQRQILADFLTLMQQQGEEFK
ncbi:MAG TPA: hypothetical protein VLB68_19050 [Pyrinomonadaceae bacterium]|nr:hypothetical protein [Pyrinomonadaceae bacterium]